MADGAVPIGTKLCKGCGYVLDVASFGLKYPERGTRQHLCRVCSRAAPRMHYERNPGPYKARAKAGRKETRVRIRRKLHEFLVSGHCLDCGISDLAVLEFDHRDPRQKEIEIAELARHAWSWGGGRRTTRGSKVHVAGWLGAIETGHISTTICANIRALCVAKPIL